MKTVGIVTKYNDNCIFCGRPTTEEHHLLCGTGFRKLAEEDGIKVPVCEYCHTKSPVAQRVHDDMRTRSAVENVAHDVERVNREPLNQVAHRDDEIVGTLS